jgi:hypothetical protein
MQEWLLRHINMAISTKRQSMDRVVMGMRSGTQLTTAKRSRTHEWIDQRSLALDRAVAEKIREQPGLLQLARNTLTRWIAQREPAVPRVFLEWQEILDRRSLVEILELLTSMEDGPRRLRQSSPFCGILTPLERKAILLDYESR